MQADCIIYFSFLHNEVCFNKLELSVSDVIVSQKAPMEKESYISLGGTKLFAQNECALWYWASVQWKMNQRMISSACAMKNEL